MNPPEQSTDEFLASVAHELRTPLTSLLGAIGLIAGGAGGVLPNDAKLLADIAQRNGERLSRLIDDLLDLTRLEGDRMRLTLRTLELESLIQEAVAQHQVLASRHEIRLQIIEPQPRSIQLDIERCATTPGSEPAIQAIDGSRLWVAVDEDRFQQVMANVLVNAIRHSPAGGAVQIATQDSDRSVRITVRDQGPGIDPALHARLFERFAHSQSGRPDARDGNGLGLYLSRLLIERMGGRIEAAAPGEQEPGTQPARGATFHLELPRVGAAEPRV